MTLTLVTTTGNWGRKRGFEFVATFEFSSFDNFCPSDSVRPSVRPSQPEIQVLTILLFWSFGESEVEVLKMGGLISQFKQKLQNRKLPLAGSTIQISLAKTCGL